MQLNTKEKATVDTMINPIRATILTHFLVKVDTHKHLKNLFLH